MIIGIKFPLPKVPEVLTTGQFARIARVAPRTVSKWCDSGRLSGYRLPGSLDRRIPVSAAVQFLRDNKMPIPPELLSRRVVSYGLQSDETFDEVEGFTCPFAFGLLCGREQLIAAAVLGDCDGARPFFAAARIVREHSPFARIVAVIGEDADPLATKSVRIAALPDAKKAAPHLFDEVFCRPANWPLILAAALKPVEDRTTAPSRFAAM